MDFVQGQDRIADCIDCMHALSDLSGPSFDKDCPGTWHSVFGATDCNGIHKETTLKVFKSSFILL